MVGREDFQRISKTRANKKVMAIKQLLFAANQVVFIIISIIFYVFDLRVIESSMLFAVFRTLRTPVPNGQSSHI
jgi:hypothetical protein